MPARTINEVVQEIGRSEMIKKGTERGARSSSLKRLAGALMLCVAMILSGAMTPVAEAAVTVSQSGSVGSLVAAGLVRCQFYPGSGGTTLGFIEAPWTEVTRAPSRTTSTQTIMAIDRLDYWNGSAWVNGYGWNSWRSATAKPGTTRVDLFADASTFYVTHNPNGNVAYRVATLYRWYVGSTKIGEVLNFYEQSDYVSYPNWSYDAPAVGATGSGQSSWCYL